jgi:hypothetical protein
MAKGEPKTLSKTAEKRAIFVREYLIERNGTRAELRRRMHDPIPEVGKWLKSVVGGHIRYYGVPGNRYALANFRFAVGTYWHRKLRRRSQNGRVHWERNETTNHESYSHGPSLHSHE